MKTNRPKIDVPLEPLDIIVDLISLVLLIFIITYTLMVYADLPETISTHFNAQGEADGFGSKLTIWILPSIGLAMFIGLYFMNKFPHIHNYNVNITEENALKNYRLSNRIVRFTNLFSLTLFAIITFDIIQLAKGFKTTILGTTFLIITLVLPIIGVAIILYYQKKINK
ncbi:MAG: DUF1648 domain-containing protein [Bacteroidetes bacterium]|nr:DUF1648 domain-containing protein [Bacteroidota bacterium]